MSYKNVLHFILALLGAFFLKFIFVYFFSYPFSLINFVAMMVALVLAFSEKGSVVWLAFMSYFLLELYATDLFGILLCSGTISALFSVWLYRYFFTNRSWYAIACISAMQVLLLRILYLFFLLLTSQSFLFSYKLLILDYFVEILLTTFVTALVYLAISLIKHKKGPTFFTFAN